MVLRQEREKERVKVEIEEEWEKEREKVDEGEGKEREKGLFLLEKEKGRELLLPPEKERGKALPERNIRIIEARIPARAQNRRKGPAVSLVEPTRMAGAAPQLLSQLPQWRLVKTVSKTSFVAMTGLLLSKDGQLILVASVNEGKPRGSS